MSKLEWIWLLSQETIIKGLTITLAVVGVLVALKAWVVLRRHRQERAEGQALLDALLNSDTVVFNQKRDLGLVPGEVLFFRSPWWKTLMFWRPRVRIDGEFMVKAIDADTITAGRIK